MRATHRKTKINSRRNKMKNSTIKKIAGTATVKAFVFALFLMATAHNASAQNTQYIYCELQDNIQSTAYFSGVFAGDYSQQLGYSVAFTNFVHGNFPNVIGVASCFFGSDPGSARSGEDGMRSNARMVYGRIVDTQWAY
jgi:hypothetical protein